jgi:branched-chain amino acid transport system ATP-binding protein
VLREEGATILPVDQMAALALSVADRACVLQSGTIHSSETAQQASCAPVSIGAQF